MTEKEALLEERESLHKEHLKFHMIRMDALNKLNDLVSKYPSNQDGSRKDDSVPSRESVYEYEYALKEEREASEKCKVIFGKILKINEKLSKM